MHTVDERRNGGGGSGGRTKDRRARGTKSPERSRTLHTHTHNLYIYTQNTHCARDVEIMTRHGGCVTLFPRRFMHASRTVHTQHTHTRHTRTEREIRAAEMRRRNIRITAISCCAHANQNTAHANSRARECRLEIGHILRGGVVETGRLLLLFGGLVTASIQLAHKT